MIGEKDKFWVDFEKQLALELRWCQVASDCFRGGYQPPETHEMPTVDSRVRRITIVARMTTTGDGNDWNRRHAECSRKDTVAPRHAGIANEHSQLEIDVFQRPQPCWRPVSIEHRCDHKISLRFQGRLTTFALFWTYRLINRQWLSVQPP